MSPNTLAVVNGEVDVSEWDDEELVRGKRRNAAGHFTGKKPTLIPAACLKELNRRKYSKSMAVLASTLEAAAKKLRAAIVEEKPITRNELKAISLLFDLFGLPKRSVQLDVSGEPTPWQRLMAKAIVGTWEQADEAEIIEAAEADILDDTPDEDGDPRVWPRE